jgi:hypothetical protein
MTEQEKKNGGKTRKPSRRGSPSKGDQGPEIKVVELGVIEDESALMKEISIQIDSLGEVEKGEPGGAGKKKAAAVSGQEHRKVVKRQPEKDGPSPAGTLSVPAQKAALPVRKAAAGVEKRAPTASPRQKLEEARRRSAEAAKKARQKKTGRGVAFLLAAGGLLLALGAVGALTFFRPEPLPEPQKPVTFSVRNAPGIKIEPPPSKTGRIIALDDQKTPAAGSARAAAPPPAPPEEQDPAAAREKTEAEIKAFLASWKAAWEASAGPNGRIDPYISHFSNHFRDGAMGLADWKADKAAKNRRKEWIRIGIRDVRIAEPAADGTVTVRFLQTYESSNYSDKTEKTLVLGREGRRWKIIAFGGGANVS